MINKLKNLFKNSTRLNWNKYVKLPSDRSKLISSSLNNTKGNLFFIFRKKIKLTNNNSTATNPEKNWSSDELAFVEGDVLKKGSSIRFKI